MGLAIFKGCPLDRLIVLLDHFKHILSFFNFLFPSSCWLFQCIEYVLPPSFHCYVFHQERRQGNSMGLMQFAVKTNLWHETQVFPMPKESFFESVADKWCLFRPTAGHFIYQWLWVMRRDFPPLPLLSHPIWLWWQWDFKDIGALPSALFCLVQNASSKDWGGIREPWLFCRPTPDSCSGEPHEGALSPSKNDIPIREFPNTFLLRTSLLQTQRDWLFLVSSCERCWRLVTSFPGRRWEPQAAGSPCPSLVPALVP